MRFFLVLMSCLNDMDSESQNKQKSLFTWCMIYGDT